MRGTGRFWMKLLALLMVCALAACPAMAEPADEAPAETEALKETESPAETEAPEETAALYQLPQPSILPEDRVLQPTETWEPPVIDESVKDTEPWMLVIKIAQEELGYTEGPGRDESKYGTWYAGKRTAWCAEFLTWCVNEADRRYGTSMLHNLFPFYGKSREGAPWFIQRERFVCAGTQVPGSHEKMWLMGADRYIQNKEYVPRPGDYM